MGTGDRVEAFAGIGEAEGAQFAADDAAEAERRGREELAEGARRGGFDQVEPGRFGFVRLTGDGAVGGIDGDALVEIAAGVGEVGDGAGGVFDRLRFGQGRE